MNVVGSLGRRGSVGRRCHCAEVALKIATLMAADEKFILDCRLNGRWFKSFDDYYLQPCAPLVDRLLVCRASRGTGVLVLSDWPHLERA